MDISRIAYIISEAHDELNKLDNEGLKEKLLITYTYAEKIIDDIKKHNLLYGDIKDVKKEDVKVVINNNDDEYKDSHSKII